VLRMPGSNGRLISRRWWRNAACAGLLVAVAATVAVAASEGAASRTATKPSPLTAPVLGHSQTVERDDVGDPFVLTVTDRARNHTHTMYVLYWTTDWRSNVPTAVSTDLTHWRRVADSLPVLPNWATPSKTLTWGPVVQKVGQRWVLYYSTRDASTGHECIGRGTANTPLGPFIDRSDRPLVCQSRLGGDIDPSVVTSPSGSRSLLWKNDGNAVHAPVSIWEQPLTPDGLSLRGPANRLLAADQAWERGIIEGPAMLADSRGGWWLFFSGGSWQSGAYDTGVAWCATISGPCRQAPSPMLTNTPAAVSPGGFDTFTAADGQLWASYSAFPEVPANARAAMAEDRVLELAPILSH
jgi:beta-xylosidase